MPACCADLHEGSPRGRGPGVGGPASEGVQQRAHGGHVLPQVQPAPAQPPPDLPVARRNLRRCFATPVRAVWCQQLQKAVRAGTCHAMLHARR